MDEDASGRGQQRIGGWLGDFEELVAHDGETDDQAPHVRKLWNPVTYRCAFCGASFVSRAMIRRHLERHAARNAGAAAGGETVEASDEEVDERKAA